MDCLGSTSDGRYTYKYISFEKTIYIEDNNKKRQSKLLAMLCKDFSPNGHQLIRALVEQ